MAYIQVGLLPKGCYYANMMSHYSIDMQGRDASTWAVEH